VTRRIRRITVDGVAYRWSVSPADSHWLTLRLWRDGDRTPLADVRVRFDDPWVHYPEILVAARHAPDRLDELFAREPLRPGRVADLIRAVTAAGGAHTSFTAIDGDIQPA